MSEFRILYVEHAPEEEIAHYVAAMEADKATVDRAVSIEEALARLADSSYDLIVTDAYFLPAGERETSRAGRGEFGLRDIVEAVRVTHNDTRAQIVAFTWYSAELFEEHGDTLEWLDDIWEKGVMPDVLRWHVERLRRKRQANLPSRALLKRVLDLVESEPTCPWRKEIALIVKQYGETSVELDRIQQVGVYVGQIGAQMGWGAPVARFFRGIADLEVLNVGAQPSGWGHLRHVVNVFLLGYFILNGAIGRRDEVLDAVLGRGKWSDREQAWREVNFAWFVAGLFHDIGLLGQRAGDLWETLLKAVAVYEAGEVVGYTKAGRKGEVEVRGISFKCDARFSETVEALCREEGASNAEALWCKDLWNVCRADTVDHGLLSAVSIARAVSQSVQARAINAAARAAAVHNFRQRTQQVGGLKKPQLRFDDAPISSLLVLCDQLQVWDRDTGRESRLQGVGLHSAELSRLEIEGDKVVIGVAYWPFRYTLPRTGEVDAIEKKLQEVLVEDVYPTLDGIEWGELMPRVEFRATIAGRTALPGWVSGRR